MTFTLGSTARHSRVTAGLSAIGLCGLVLACAGCATTQTVADAFPPARVATPWILQGEVWTGTFDEAATALGGDAEGWRQYEPQRAWLAKYAHEDKPERTITVRAFAFATPASAERAYLRFAPVTAKPFAVADGGCWTEVGVLFHWKRLVFDIFGTRQSWDNEVQAAMLAGCITRRMPAGLPDQPR
jgi:hypothetical protein